MTNKAEVLFVKYAFPCAFIIRQRGEISQKELDELEAAAINGKVLDRVFLERVFFRAFRRIEILAQEMKKDKWDYEVIHHYFVSRHNELIENGMEAYATAPETMKDLCRVHRAKIMKVKGNYLVVQYGKENKLRPVMGEMISNPKVGELVTIHYGYAVEKVNV